jgi:hypothetical protein
MRASAPFRELQQAIAGRLPAYRARVAAFSAPFSVAAWNQARARAASACDHRNQIEMLYELGCASVAECADAHIADMLATKIRRMFDRAARVAQAAIAERSAQREQRARERAQGIVYRYGRKPQED